MKSRRDDLIVARGKRSAAPGYTAPKFYFPLPMVAVRQDWGEGGRRPGEGNTVPGPTACLKKDGDFS
jgi:hypothetical protein